MRIALLGYGKMGLTIETIGLDRKHNFPLKINSSTADRLTSQHLSACDVAIEFSTPMTAFKHIKICLENRVPVVCGTTGWLELLPEVYILCKRHKGAFLHAANFSIGVHLFFHLNKYLAQMMNRFCNYDVSIYESHHKEKKDAPSGTAIQLADDALFHLERKEKWALKNQDNKLPSTYLGIESAREEGVVGTHEVSYHSEQDTISVTHRAHNRSGFAMGALLAAEYIHNRQGIFTMQDVVGFSMPHIDSKNTIKQ